MSYVMFYTTEVRPESVGKVEELRAKFMEIYKDHGVNVIGHWKQADNERVSYYMTQYESEADYRSKVQQLHNDPRYTELTGKLDKIRTASNAKKLVPV
jgi:hypothetical protein